jgi:hypothetical protein
MDDTEKRRQSVELNARDLAPVLTRGGPVPASSFSFFIFILMGLPLRNAPTHSGPFICIVLYKHLFLFSLGDLAAYRNAHLFFFFSHFMRLS